MALVLVLAQLLGCGAWAFYYRHPLAEHTTFLMRCVTSRIKGARRAIDDAFIPFSFVTALITNNNSAQVSAKKIFCNKIDLNHFMRLIFMLP